MAVIEYDSYKQKLLAMSDTFENLQKALDIESSKHEIARLEAEAHEDGFWNDIERSQANQMRTKQLQNKVHRFEKLISTRDDLLALIDMGNEMDDASLLPELTWYGSAPDCGSVIEMLHTATGRRPKVIGKPQPEMALLAMEQTGFSPRETCLIGDRVYTDIACGVNAGIDTIFVLSGEGVMDDIEKYGVQPTYCMQNIREVLNTLEKGEPK